MASWPHRAVQLAEHTPFTFRELVVLMPLADAAGIDEETLERMIMEACQLGVRHQTALDWLYSCIALGKRTCR